MTSSCEITIKFQVVERESKKKTEKTFHVNNKEKLIKYGVFVKLQ